MKKFLAVGYMLAFPLVSGAKILPSVMLLLFYTIQPAAGPPPFAGIFQLMGFPAATIVTLPAFSYFVSGFFPTPSISNFIMGL